MDLEKTPVPSSKRKAVFETPKSLGKRTVSSVLAEKKEHLRKLRLVKFYRQKHSLPQLEVLIAQWTVACQQALQQLHDKLTASGRHDVTMETLLHSLNIHSALVKYNTDTDEFDEVA